LTGLVGLQATSRHSTAQKDDRRGDSGTENE
jgi:hypothetical protein